MPERNQVLMYYCCSWRSWKTAHSSSWRTDLCRPAWYV